MSAVTMDVRLPRGPWRADDLAHFPDDGVRYELVDGALLVSPAPAPRHQDVVGALYRLLFAAAPPDLKVFLAPFDVRLSATRLLQPDLVVVRRTDMTHRGLVGLPLLAIEVLSPATQAVDRTLKRLALEQAGVPSYWLVEPDVPALTVLQLREEVFVEAAVVVGDQQYEATQPFPLRIVPADLRDDAAESNVP